MAGRLNASPSPMNFDSALRAIPRCPRRKADIYVVNEGANTLDFGRDIIDMYQPRKRLDCGTWGVMGIGMGLRDWSGRVRRQARRRHRRRQRLWLQWNGD